MAKYYRVRTQEQWDWLMQWFEKENRRINWAGDSPTAEEANNFIDYGTDTAVLLNNNNCLEYSPYDFYIDKPEYEVEQTGDFIEVSQMTEESKMEDYVTINSHDLEKIKFDRPQEDGNSFVVNKVNPLGDSSKYTREVELPVRLRIPKSLLYPKVRMTEAEKKEFDDVKKHVTALYNAMVLIFEHRDECINLNNKLFYSAPPKYLNDVQRDFARAWTDESLIEVIPDKKWNVKVPHIENRFYFKHTDGGLKGASSAYNDDYNQQFTVEELKYYGLEDESIYKRVEVEE